MGWPVSAPAQPSAHPPDSVPLAPIELDACWELLGLGDPLPVLRLPSPGRTWTERREILTTVLATLRRRGLASPDGQVHELVARPLRILADPDRRLDLHVEGDRHGAQVAVGAARDGQGGALVTRRAEGVRVREIRPARLVPEVVGLLGGEGARPGTGRPVNLPVEAFDQACAAAEDGSLWTVVDGLVARGVTKLDATGWARMCTDIQVVGQLGGAVRTESGLKLSPWVIGFHGTPAGYYLQLRRPDAFGGTLTVCPLDHQRLLRLAEEMLTP